MRTACAPITTCSRCQCGSRCDVTQNRQPLIMRYPVAIEPRTDQSAYGVVIPDLPGCFSAGDTLEEAIAGAEEAGLAWIDAALDAGGGRTRRLRRWKRSGPSRNTPAGFSRSLIDRPFGARRHGRSAVNVTLPRRVLRRLDDDARAAGETRSGYIAKLAISRQIGATPAKEDRRRARHTSALRA